MELQQLIAGPLIATIEADSLSSQRYLDYLMKIAFESYDPATGRTGKIRMLTFNYQSQDAGGGRKQSVSIPILTLVPLPLLQVQEADFDFDIKILDALSETAEEKFSLEEGKSVSEPQSGEDSNSGLRWLPNRRGQQHLKCAAEFVGEYESKGEDASGGCACRIVQLTTSDGKQHASRRD